MAISNYLYSCHKQHVKLNEYHNINYNTKPYIIIYVLQYINATPYQSILLCDYSIHNLYQVIILTVNTKDTSLFKNKLFCKI